MIRIKVVIILAVFVMSLFCAAGLRVGAASHTANAGAPCDDIDDDGWCPPEDCDDGDPSIHPGAVEIPNNGIDENCDGSDAPVCYVDSDGDGYGDPYSVMYSADGDCDDPGESYTGTDCDDLDGSIHPGAIDVPDDGIDQDCDGFDASSSAAGEATWSAIKALFRTES